MKKELKTFLVIPTIRNLSFLKNWKREFKNCHLIVIEDREMPRIAVPNKNFASINCFSYIDLDKDFGKDSWIFSRKNAGIRSYGFWKAFKMGADVIITLDDDCFPAQKNFVENHLKNLVGSGSYCLS